MQPQPEEKRRKFPLVPIAIVLLVLAVGVTSFLLWPKGGNRNNASNNPPMSSTSSTPPATSQSQTDSQTQQQTTTETPPQQTSSQPTPPNNTLSQNPPATPQTAQQAIEAYFALIPNNLPAGYATLTDNFKSVRVKTFAEYQTFWSKYSAVQLSNVTPQGENIVTVTQQFMQGSTVTNTETHTYTLVQQNGKWMIDRQD